MRPLPSWLALAAGLAACGAEPSGVRASPPVGAPAVAVPNHVFTESEADGAPRALEAGDRVTVRLRGGPWTQTAAPGAFLAATAPARWEGGVQVFTYAAHASGRGELVFATPQGRQLVFILAAR